VTGRPDDRDELGVDTTANAREGSPQSFAGMRAWMASRHRCAKVEQWLDPILGRGAPVASHEVAESMSMPGVVEDGKQLERWSLGPNTQTNPVADHEATIRVCHQV
jgi:hypothetical protein